MANMFSHMVGSLFILILFSLAVWKLFVLMRSHLFILSFMSLALGDISVKILLREISEIFLHMFSSRTLMVSHNSILKPNHNTARPSENVYSDSLMSASVQC